MSGTVQVCDGVPMTPDQLRNYLQELYGMPVAVRMEESLPIKCPYCMQTHDCEPGAGHHIAQCTYGGTEISIGTRSFIPSYGLTVFEYKNEGGVNKLTVPENLTYT
jgi:hypothetical protein